jgi:hypothetical protein
MGEARRRSREKVVCGPKTGSGHEIRELWAIVGVLDDGDDAIPCVMSPPWISPAVAAPLIASDAERLAWIKEQGRTFAWRHGKAVKLVRFSVREDLETFDP